MALAGHHEDIARAQQRRPQCGSPCPGRQCPVRRERMLHEIAARIAAGSSDRGLSSVTITMSAFSAAMAPIRGRLPRSRSPPHPNTQIEPARRERTQSVQDLGKGIGFMGIIDNGRGRHSVPRRVRGCPFTPLRRDSEASTRGTCPRPAQRWHESGCDERVGGLEVSTPAADGH